MGDMTVNSVCLPGNGKTEGAARPQSAIGLETRTNTPDDFASALEAVKKRLSAVYAPVSSIAADYPSGGHTGGGRAAVSDASGSLLSSGISGDYLKPFDLSSLSADSKPVGAAANSGQTGTIDRTSKLYAQALELESYFVKIMLSSMRNTIAKTDSSSSDSFAARTYEDMLYDQLARTVTEKAGFGLADQVYLQFTQSSAT